MPINVQNVFYTYAKKTPFASEALHGINCRLEEGAFIAIVGQTGSGKSTFVQLLNGLLLPTSGTIDVNQFHLQNKKRKNKNLKQLRKHVGLVFQFPEYQLFEETVEKDVAFGPRNFKVNKEEALKKAHEALLAVGLDESYFKRSPFELSGGEKRRVAIAGILAIEPEILVLDEPTAGLDPIGSANIMSLIEKMHQNGKTIILVTHNMDLVKDYASRAIVLKEGRIVCDTDAQALFKESLDDLALKMPPLYDFVKRLTTRGFSFNNQETQDVDTFAKAIMEQRRR